MTEAGEGWPTRVLVVDDEPTIQALFEHVLPEVGFELSVAVDAERAVELLDREPFACVVTDKNLPGMDGLRLMGVVQQTQPYCACIIMTGYPSMDSLVEALRGGAADYLIKPFESLDLVVEKIRNAVRRQRAVYEARVLRQRVQAIRQDLSDRDARLAQMAGEIEHLSEVVALSNENAASGGGELTPEQLTRALDVTINLARSLLTYATTLSSILEASPLTRDDSKYIDGFSAAAGRLDAHLETLDFMRKKT